MKVTVGMKTCLKALLSEAYNNLYWLILALALTLLLWLAPKVNATPLDNFLTEHKLEFPQVVKDQMKEQDLVAAAGVMNEKEKIFTVYFLPKPETFDIQEFDVRRAVMQCQFYLSKRKIIVEYHTCRSCQSSKGWPSCKIEVIVLMELWPL